MYQEIINTLNGVALQQLSAERKAVLQPLIDFVQGKISTGESVNLNFICTHNSRRSHLSQVWAQVAAYHFNMFQVSCYSGGTEETALFPFVASTLQRQGFEIYKLAEAGNPIYTIKYATDRVPIIGFSKRFDHPFNPSSNYAAVMTCSQADEGCPYIAGAEKRIAVTFEDPKLADHTPQQAAVYTARSLQIAAEMYYVFSTVAKAN